MSDHETLALQASGQVLPVLLAEHRVVPAVANLFDLIGHVGKLEAHSVQRGLEIHPSGLGILVSLDEVHFVCLSFFGFRLVSGSRLPIKGYYGAERGK